MIRIIIARFLGAVLVVSVAACAAVHDPASDDPNGDEVAVGQGSVRGGLDGVDIFVAAVDDQARYPGRVPSHERRMLPGMRRVTVYVPGALVAGLSEFQFKAVARRRHEIRARKGGGFFLMDLVDISNPAESVIVLSGKFGAGPMEVPVPTSPFVVISHS